MLIQLLNGFVYGGLLYVLSVGLVLIFGLRRVVNFAHGSLFMLGAYIGYSVAQLAGFFPRSLSSTNAPENTPQKISAPDIDRFSRWCFRCLEVTSSPSIFQVFSRHRKTIFFKTCQHYSSDCCVLIKGGFFQGFVQVWRDVKL